MAVRFHPDAAKRFDERGTALRAAIREIQRPKPQTKNGNFTPDRVPVASFTEDDIQNLTHLGEVNQITGERRRLLFDDGNHAYELGRDGCRDFENLAAAILKTPSLSQLVAAAWVEEEIRRWLDPQNSDTRTLSERLIAEIESAVRRFTVWVPIAYLHIQSELVFGSIVFKPISAAIFDEMEAACPPRPPEDEARIRALFLTLRKRYQGLTAVTLEIEAEATRAHQIAVETAERSVALLRTLCVENLHPRTCSYCVPMGRLALVGDDIWLAPEPSSFSFTDSLVPPIPIPWIIDDRRLPEMNEIGLTALAEIAALDGSNFDKKLVEALLIYNRANISRDPVDKLIYVLVALESMLLKNQSEQIQESVGIRMAFIIGKDADERVQIVALLRECYGIRSRYIHHGQSREDFATLEKFMRYAWVFFTRLVRAHKFWPSKDALIDRLDRRKFE